MFLLLLTDPEGPSSATGVPFFYFPKKIAKKRKDLHLCKSFSIASVNSDYINTQLAIDTLTEALNKEKPKEGIILHSDKGVPYTSWEFVKFCKDNGVIQSMSKAGYPYDNAHMERLK